MSERILIADGGSTKCAWALVECGQPPQMVTTRGCNAATASPEECAEMLAEGLAALRVEGESIDRIEYYGAGCATPEICKNVERAFAGICKIAEIYIGSDLEGAAKALFENKAGIACILGTGSNSALYDGNRVVKNVPPLGFIIGDEGSGASLGRRLVRDALRGELEPELIEESAREFGVTKENVLRRVYKEPGGNVFLASTVPFLARHRNHESIRHILIEEFTAFFEHNVDLYPECRDYSLGFVGSVAVHFRKELEQVATSMGYFIGDMIDVPIKRLAEITLRKLSMQK